MSGSAPEPSSATKRYASRRFARRFDRLRRLQLDRPSLVERIAAIVDLAGARVIELGAGSGVITQELAQRAGCVAAFDRSPAMLKVAQVNLERRGLHNCRLALAEHQRIPLSSGCADLVLATWSLDSAVYGSDEASWRTELDRIIAEMCRLTAAGGVTMVVGSPIGARDIAGHLESTHGFKRRLLKTVWRFPTRRTAKAATTLFFGKRVWQSYKPHWPKDMVTLAGIWWHRDRRPRD